MADMQGGAPSGAPRPNLAQTVWRVYQDIEASPPRRPRGYRGRRRMSLYQRVEAFGTRVIEWWYGR